MGLSKIYTGLILLLGLIASFSLKPKMFLIETKGKTIKEPEANLENDLGNRRAELSNDKPESSREYKY